MKNIFFLLFCLIPYFAFSQIIYVDSSAVSGQNTGADWNNAYTDLQDALSIATEGNEIWVAKGTYFPTNDTNREIYFELPNNVVLLGGFEGTETNSDQRDWEQNKTKLSGDIGVEGDSLDNSYTVLYAIDTGSNTKLDGFIIERGNANGSIPIDPTNGLKKSGGGLYLKGENGPTLMTINNCIFQNNYAAYYGGGVYLLNAYTGSVNTSFDNCQFYYNSAGLGGGISKFGGGNVNFVNEINNCNFEYNNAVRGGAIYIVNTYGTNPIQITNSSFFYNSTTFLGGAIGLEHSVQDNSTFKVEGCVFEGNYSPGGGTLLLNVSNNDYSIRISHNQFINNIDEAVIIHAVIVPDIIIESCSFINGGRAISGIFNEVNNCLFVKTTLGINIPIYQSEPFSANIGNSTFFSDSEYNGSVLYIQSDKIDVHFNNSILINTGSGGIISTNWGDTDTSKLFLNNCLTGFDSCLGGISVSPQNAGRIECNAMIYNQDPLFKDTANMDFSLLACSPAIDAGDNAYVSDLLDVVGNDRIINGTVDIGAYEASATFLTIDTLIDAVCHGENGGAIGFSYNGQPPFVTEWDNGMTTGISTDSLAAGTYSLTVTDANDCSETIDFEITQSDSLEASFVAQEVTCPDGIDGGAALTIQGGTPDYFISWSSGEIGFEANLLMGGWNEVTIVDANNCELIDSVFIEEPDAIFAFGDITNATSNNTSDGAIEIFNITGGTPPFQLEWNTGDTTALIENLSPDAYIVTIMDANGCVTTQGFLVSFNTGTTSIENGEIVILPNPVERSADLKIELKNISTPLNIKLYNAVGCLIQHEVETIPTNQINLKIPENAGVYFLSISQDDKFWMVKKIVVY
jgi:Secretion system C-terminal sorting domain/SprB repeat